MAYTTSDCIARLVAYTGSLHIAHWRADTVTNEHKALGDLYESMSDLVDEFTEVYLGKNGMVTFPFDAQVTDVLGNACAEGLKLVSDLKKEFKAGKDDDILNIIADMEISLNKAKYLLKEGGKEDEDEMPEETKYAFHRQLKK